MSDAPTIFYSYAHEDEFLQQKLVTALSMLHHKFGTVDRHDRCIGVGTEWEGQIDEWINKAHIILLLISPDFCNSRYCYDVEMRRAMERHNKAEAKVIPIFLRKVAGWEDGPFARLSGLPRDAKFVTGPGWSNIDDAFAEIGEGIRAVLESMNAAGRFAEQRDRQSRYLEAAVSRTAVVGQNVDVSMMVSAGPGALSRFLKEESEVYTAKPSDVKVQHFALFFPVSHGIPADRDVGVRLSAPDCDPAAASRTLRILADADSAPTTFLVTPLRQGTRLITLEVLESDTSLVSRTLRTDAEAHNPPGGGLPLAHQRPTGPLSPEWGVLTRISLEVYVEETGEQPIAAKYRKVM